MQTVTLTRYPEEDALRRVLAMRRARKSRTAPWSDYHDRRRPATTKEKLLIDEHLAETYISSNKAQLHRRPTGIRHSHKPEPVNPSVCTNNNKNKDKTTKENINLTGSNSGKDHSSTTLRLGEQNIHHWRPVE